MNCPKCYSTNTHFRPIHKNWICDECDNVFESDKEHQTLRVFVSYGHDEYLPFARNVANELKVRGHEIWFDEERLKPGGDWEIYIEEGLNWVSGNKVNGRILLIITPYSVRRPDGYCLNEIAKALDNRLSIIPVMLVWATPPLSIYRLQYLDLLHSQNKLEITESFQNDFDKICQALEQPKYLDTTGASACLVESLEPLDFGADLTLHQPWFTGREWVFEEIQKWIGNNNAKRLFWLAGMPGIGKTAIATQLIHNVPNIAAFHLCRRGHSEKSSPKRTVCSIAYQLSTQLPEYRELLLKIDIKREVSRCNDLALFDVLIVQPLNHINTPSNTPLIILIDALDEATFDGRNEMAAFIGSEFEKLPKWIRIILTSRPDEECLSNLQCFEPCFLKSQQAKNENDIILYIGKRLGQKITGNGLEIMINHITRSSQGSFLYIKCICDDILNGKKVDVSNPNMFPSGMSGFYFHYFSEKFPNKQYYRENIRPALEVMIAAFEPLTRDELTSILYWDNDRIDDFLQGIGSFIIESEKGKLIPFHASLFDWLVDKNSTGIYWSDKNRGAKIICSFFEPIWKEYLLSYDSLDDYKKKTGKILADFNIMEDLLFRIYINALLIQKDHEAIIYFMRWYISIPSISIPIVRFISTIEDKYFDKFNGLAIYTSYEETLKGNIKKKVDRLMEASREAIPSLITKHVYILSLYFAEYLDIKYSDKILDRRCSIFREVFPEPSIYILRSGFSYEDTLCGCYADEIRGLFYNLIKSEKIKSQNSLKWLSSIAKDNV